MTRSSQFFKEHRALITGASSGIGKEYAKQLAAMGCDLVLVARRLDRLKNLAEEIQTRYQVKIQCIQLDLALPHASLDLFKQVTQGGNQITVLVNNAGLGKYGAFLDFPLEDHQSTIQVNLVAPTELSYLFAKHMKLHGRPSFLVQVASISAFQPVSNFSVYSATKGYLRYFSETLRFELRKTNIHVFCLCPGGTYTEFFEHSGQKITSSGHRTMMSAEEVVASALNAMIRKVDVFTPGLLNKLACFFPRFLPRRLALFLAYKTMSMAVEAPKPSIEKLS
jgi:short-subunit dehydrogenase